jgi:hypothetical protein
MRAARRAPRHTRPPETTPSKQPISPVRESIHLNLSTSTFTSPSVIATSLTYARDAAGRPGTPEPGGRGVEAATHAHAPGRGVVHVGDAYHRVEPLASGARGTLVLMSMRDDAAWKRRYYDDDGE